MSETEAEPVTPETPDVPAAPEAPDDSDAITIHTEDDEQISRLAAVPLGIPRHRRRPEEAAGRRPPVRGRRDPMSRPGWARSLRTARGCVGRAGLSPTLSSTGSARTARGCRTTGSTRCTSGRAAGRGIERGPDPRLNGHPASRAHGHSPGPLAKCTAAIGGAVLAVVVPAWWWLRCPHVKQACD